MSSRWIRSRCRKNDDTKPVDELVAGALNKRVEIEQGRINIESNKLNLVGIKNSLKPTLQAFAELTNNGLTGDLTAFGASQGGVPYLAGGYGNLLAQIARRNFPNYSAGFSLNIPLRNRAAQSDYVTSLLEIRQNELNLQKSVIQVRVDVQNAVIGVQQARARYDAAVKARVLAAADSGGRPEEISAGRGNPVSGGAGSARLWRPRRVPKCRPWRITRTRASRSTRPWATRSR